MYTSVGNKLSKIPCDFFSREKLCELVCQDPPQGRLGWNTNDVRQILTGEVSSLQKQKSTMYTAGYYIISICLIEKREGIRREEVKEEGGREEEGKRTAYLIIFKKVL